MITLIGLMSYANSEILICEENKDPGYDYLPDESAVLQREGNKFIYADNPSIGGLDITFEDDKFIHLETRRFPDNGVSYDQIYTMIIHKETGKWVSDLLSLQAFKDSEPLPSRGVCEFQE